MLLTTSRERQPTLHILGGRLRDLTDSLIPTKSLEFKEPYVCSYLLVLSCLYSRMFGSTMEYTTRNEKGEYEVARGISANVFKCILVSIACTG